MDILKYENKVQTHNQRNTFQMFISVTELELEELS